MIAWLFAIICVEAITEIIINADIFLGLRTFLSKISPSFLGKLFTCGYCMSVWVAGCIAWSLPGTITNYPIVDIIIKAFVLHRSANLVHEGFKRWFARLPLVFVLNWVSNPAMEPGPSPDKVVEINGSEGSSPEVQAGGVQQAG